MFSGRTAQAGKAPPNHHTSKAGDSHLPRLKDPRWAHSYPWSAVTLCSSKSRPHITSWGTWHPSPCPLTLPAVEEIVRPADVRRHHFTQRPGFLAGKGWGSGEEGEEEPGAKANSIYSSLCVQKGQQQGTTWPLLLQLPLHPGKRVPFTGATARPWPAPCAAL